MKKVFIDIGAHFGESILKALQPCYGFDVVVAYEPSSLGARRVRRISEPRLEVRQMALGNKESIVTLFGAGHLGGSLYGDKQGLLRRDDTEIVTLRRASTELGPFLDEGNEVFLKINCEGGEIEILQDLAFKNQLTKFSSVYVDWDSRKVPSLQIAMLETQELLVNYNNVFHAHDFEETGWLGVEHWLDKTILKSSTPTYRLPEHNFLRQPWRSIAFLKKRAPRVFRLLVRVRNRIRL